MGRGVRYSLFIGCLAIGFIAVLVLQRQPARPVTRLPGQYRLAGLIEDRQALVRSRRLTVAELRKSVDRVRSGGSEALQEVEAQISLRRRQAGTTATRGPGLRVSLRDSSAEPKLGDELNNFVIHSEDVQAVVNALWRSGATGVSINGQRLVGTSAVLCVGNTLLLNGTVHAPPYVISAVGARREEFEADFLVARLRADASKYALGFAVEEVPELAVPRYPGSVRVTHARPVPGRPVG